MLYIYGHNEALSPLCPAYSIPEIPSGNREHIVPELDLAVFLCPLTALLLGSADVQAYSVNSCTTESIQVIKLRATTINNIKAFISNILFNSGFAMSAITYYTLYVFAHTCMFFACMYACV